MAALGTRTGGVAVVDNAERLEPDELTDVLHFAGPRTSLVVCARTYPKAVFSRTLRPTDVLSIGERDLRLARAEIASLFDHALDDALLAQVERLTLGWPIAVQVLLRAARIGRLQALIDEPDDLEFRRLHGFIRQEIVGPLNDGALERLCTIAALEPTTLDELATVLGGEPEHVLNATRALPLVREERGRFSLHPLLASFVQRHAGRRKNEAAQRAAEALRQRGQVLRAAHVALAAGEARRAADFAEGEVRALASPTQEVAELVRRLDLGSLHDHPRLWGIAMRHRDHEFAPLEVLTRAFATWDRLDTAASAETILDVADVIRAALARAGSWDEVEAFELECASRMQARGVLDEPRVATSALVARARAAVARGDAFDADAVQRVLSTELSEVVRVVALIDVVAPAAAAAANRGAERRALEDAIVRSRRTCIHALVSRALFAAAATAWLAGEQPLFDRYVDGLRALVEEHGADDPVARRLIGAAACRVVPLDHRIGPAECALTALVLAAHLPDGPERRSQLEDAVRDADASGQLRVRVLARLAAASAALDADRLSAEARTLAAASADVALQQAIESGSGTLASFLRRFPAGGSADPPEAEELFEVQVLTGRVVHDGAMVALSPKEFALLGLLAVHNEPVEAETLLEALWPNAPLDDRTVGLRVYVNRLRKRLGDPRVVQSTQYGYARGPTVRTDLDEIADFVARLPRDGGDAATVEQAMRYLRSLLAGPATTLLDLVPVPSVYARINLQAERIEAWLQERRTTFPIHLRIAVDAVLESEEEEPLTP
ncbi:MAG TPA: winged helix-turn-helix domain-containing protein [Candidatus Sulfotelmatobacter sp.]|nr:winged helix-turn-helix domain-containing protein [Candidatus Sulfotelmatobacter sp.]